MPHSSPMMNTSPQITRVDEMMRMPACRSVSPKNRIARPRRTSLMILPVNLKVSPADSIQPLGAARMPFTCAPLLDHGRDLGMGREQRLREHVVEREHAQER